MTRHRWAWILLTLSSLACWAVSDTKAQTRERPFDLELRIECSQQDIRCGDEIPIAFTITNKDPEPFSYEYRTYDRSGRMEEYELIARRVDGSVVPDPRDESMPTMAGGLVGGLRQLSTGDSFRMAVPLNLWARITEPGQYSVTGIYRYAIEDKDKKPLKGCLFTRYIRVRSSPVEIQVRPRNREEMGAYIQGLAARLGSLNDVKDPKVREERRHLAARLAYTCDPRIIPTMLDLMYGGQHGNEVFQAAEALWCYLPHSDEVKSPVLNAARTHGLTDSLSLVLDHLGCSEGEFAEVIRLSLASSDPNIVYAAVLAAQEYPADEYMPKVIELATGSVYSDRRGRAIVAIASHRTDEGVAALKRLLDDPDPEVRRRALDAVKEAYRRHPVFPEKVDEALTKSLVALAMDPTCPFQCTAAYAVARTRTPEGVRAVQNLLVDPNADVPLIQTDLGVRTIRDLLRDGDPDLRGRIRIDIGGVYHEYRGRPFRPDDFPAEFQETPEQFKQKMLKGLLKK